MERYGDTAHGDASSPAPEDLDLRDERARSSHRGWFAAMLLVDALAVLAFVSWVVLPELT